MRRCPHVKRSWPPCWGRFSPTGGNQHGKASGNMNGKSGPNMSFEPNHHRRNTGPMLGKPALRRPNAGQALQVAGRERKKAMSHARWCARFRRAARESERAQAWPLYPRSHCTTPEDVATVLEARPTILSAACAACPGPSIRRKAEWFAPRLSVLNAKSLCRFVVEIKE